MRWVWVYVMGAAVMAGAVRGAAPIDADDAGAMGALAERLADANPAEREKAQGFFEAIPVWKYKQVESWAAKAGNAEAKARLAARAGEMEDVAGFNPEPVNVRVKDATLKEVVEALDKATRVQFPFQDYQEKEPPDVRFTLDVKGVPFCEVISRLSAQHALAVKEDVKGPGFVLAGKDVAALVISRGAVVSVTARAAVTRRNGPAVRVNMVLIGGPFSQIVMMVGGMPGSESLEVINPATGKAVGKPGAAEELVGASAGPEIWQHEGTIPIDGAIPERVNISGKVILPVAGPEQHREFLPAEHMGEKIAFGENVVQVVKFEEQKGDPNPPGPRSLTCRIAIAGDDGALAAPEPDGTGALEQSVPSHKYAGSPNYDLAFKDSRGWTVWTTRMPVGAAALINGQIKMNFVPPLRVVLSRGANREVTVPFEFKDVAVAK